MTMKLAIGVFGFPSIVPLGIPRLFPKIEASKKGINFLNTIASSVGRVVSSMPLTFHRPFPIVSPLLGVAFIEATCTVIPKLSILPWVFVLVDDCVFFECSSDPQCPYILRCCGCKNAGTCNRGYFIPISRSSTSPPASFCLMRLLIRSPLAHFYIGSHFFIY